MEAPPDSKTAREANPGAGDEIDGSIDNSRHTVSPSRPQAKIDDARRISREIDEAFPPNWSGGVVDHSYMQRWRDDLLLRVWKHKAMLLRIGRVGHDWEQLVEELTEFTYIKEHMALEITRRSPPKLEEAA